MSGGHYFAFVKPGRDGQWLKFDDDRVLPCNLKEVLEENYGGEQTSLAGVNMRPNGRPINRFTNAYMLVYIRECMIDNVLAPVTEEDIPRHLAERIETENRLREMKLRESEEQKFYMKVLVATNDTFRANTGFDFVKFDELHAEENHLLVHKLRKDSPFYMVKEDLSKLVGIPANQFRVWMMVNRQNRTVRVDEPIYEDDSILEEIRKKYAVNQQCMRFYLEPCSNFDEKGDPVYPDTTDTILIFIKQFKPESQTIHGVNHLHVNKNTKVGSIVGVLKEMMGLSQNEEILLFEEVKASMVDPVDMNSTFHEAELQNGDILCAQRKSSAEEENAIVAHGGQKNASDYMDYLLGKVVIYFSPLKADPNAPELFLELHKDMDYDQVAMRVAAELNIDSTKLRLINPQIQAPGRQPLKRFGGMKLGHILPHNAVQKSRFLYEILEVSLEEMESKCSVSVTICTPTLKNTKTVDFLLPKDSGLVDLKEALVAKGVRFETTTGTRDLRIFDETDGKFDNEYDDKLWREVIANNPVVKVYAEEIPEEEANMESDSHFIPCFPLSPYS